MSSRTFKHPDHHIDSVIYGIQTSDATKKTGDDLDDFSGITRESTPRDNRYSFDPNRFVARREKQSKANAKNILDLFPNNEKEMLSRIDASFKQREGNYSPVFLNRMGAYLKDKIVPSVREIQKSTSDISTKKALESFNSYLNEFLKHAGSVEPVMLFTGKLANIVSVYLQDRNSVDLSSVIQVCNKYLSNLSSESKQLYNELNSIVSFSIPSSSEEFSLDDFNEVFEEEVIQRVPDGEFLIESLTSSINAEALLEVIDDKELLQELKRKLTLEETVKEIEGNLLVKKVKE